MQKDTSILIEEALDDVSAPNNFGEMNNLLSQLKEAQQMVSDLELRINHIVEQIIASLGAEVRNRQPGLEVGLRNGNAHCGYRSRSIVCKPDVHKGTWDISGTPFAKTFVKRYPHLSQMGSDVKPLAHAIADFFTERYRTLR